MNLWNYSCFCFNNKIRRDGSGIQKNLRKAAELYSVAASHGDPDAWTNLRSVLKNGGKDVMRLKTSTEKKENTEGTEETNKQERTEPGYLFQERIVKYVVPSLF